MVHRLALLGVFLLAGAAGAQTPTPQPPTPPPPGCTAPECHQFDFWIGNWTVDNPKGDFVGTNDIVPILGGCVLQENWKGKKGMTGTSFNIYDASRKKWHQTWVDSSGSLLVLEGEFTDGSMILTGEQPGQKEGEIVLQKITWTPMGPDQVRQHWETSSDAGKTWATAFDGYYKRKKA